MGAIVAVVGCGRLCGEGVGVGGDVDVEEEDGMEQMAIDTHVARLGKAKRVRVWTGIVTASQGCRSSLR